MIDGLSLTLLAAAVGVAVLHTAVGPDHYLPFVALAHARGWSHTRLLGITAVCGMGHVLSSLALGATLVFVGASLGLLESIDQGRGSLAAWMLIALGLVYALWGMRLALGESKGAGRHDHEHGGKTVGALFVVFVLGPCEPLIPLVFLPAVEGRWALAGATAFTFGLATVATMVLLVGAARAGTRRLRPAFLERWLHAATGGLLAFSGAMILMEST